MSIPSHSPPSSPRANTVANETSSTGSASIPVASVSNPNVSPSQSSDPQGASATSNETGLGFNVQFSFFKSRVKSTCEILALPIDGINTTELEQMFSNRSADFLSPEATDNKGNIGAESVRSILRHQRFGLLEERGDPEENTARHRKFINMQPRSCELKKQSFKILQDKYMALSPDQIAAVKVSAVLKPSVLKTSEYKNNGHELPKDSEQYLTKVAQLAKHNNVSFMPAIEPLSQDQKKCLEQCYPTEAHFRHYFFAENGLKELNKGIESIRKLNAFEIWEARWWVDLLGFDRQQHGVTQPLFERANALFSLIEKAVKGEIKTSTIMPTYLTALQNSSGLKNSETFKGLNIKQQAVITQVVAYFEDTTAAQCENIVQAFVGLPEEIKISLTNNYQAFLLNSKAESPTYLPAVIKTANEQYFKLESNKNMAMKNAAGYTFKMLDAVYKAIIKKPETIISARDAAYAENWTKNSNTWAKSHLENKISFDVSETGAIETKES